VIDRTGKFIWRSHHTDQYVGRSARPELVAAAAASHSGLIRHSTLEGIDSYDAFTHSELTGWTIAVAAPVPTIEASATQAVAWLSAGVVMAFGVALLVATLLSRMLLGALEAASSAARALGRGEAPQPPRTSVLEVNALNDALHDAARLLILEKSARGSAERERERLLENERTARAAAQDENVAKDRFLALLGHELRNPLAAIAGASDVLARGPQDPPTQQRFVALIQRQNRHLKRIVDDLLEVSRMLSGKIVLDAHPLDLADCVRSCIESLRATDRASHFRWQVRTEPVWVCGDPVRLEQIVNNLVVNAMQFSPPDGEILVTVTTEASHAVLEVADSGPGIAPELQARIFEPFVQGPPVAGRPSSGLGIGLSLVRQLVQLHDGKVSVRSSGAGTGSTFVVRFPRVVEPPASTAAATQAGASAPGAVCAGQVLLVDDNIDAREATAALVRSLGYDVSEAGDADGAMQSAATHVPDVVVMDLGLPGKSGFQVATEMKALPSMRHIPLIALSGYGRERDRAAALAAGFNEHLVKPVTLAKLARVIEAQLTLRQGDR
jgi:signal transduction histidine kinase